LLSYLHQAPQIAALSEVLCPQLPMGPSRYEISHQRAIQHIRYSLQAERAPIRGVKLMLHQLEACRLTLTKLDAAFPDAKYIVLYRQSLAEQYVSAEAAKSTKQFIVFSGQERKQTQVTIDPGKLRTYCDDMRAGYRHAISHPWLAGRAVLLSYEELTAEPGFWLGEHICPLLGIEPLPAKTYLEKQATRPLAQQVTNYQQVATLLHSPLCKQYHVWPWERQGHRGQQRRAA
jgi:LPS sulfotransferase NodH